MIKTIKGNILNAKESIICNQVDNTDMDNTELAKQIKQKYPEVFEEYRKLLDNFDYQLGTCQCVLCNNGKTVANIFTKIDISRNDIMSNLKFLNNMVGKDWEFYFLKRSFENLLFIAKKHNLSIAIPYGIGCLDKYEFDIEWDVVYNIIENVFSDYDVVIYKLEGDLRYKINKNYRNCF